MGIPLVSHVVLRMSKEKKEERRRRRRKEEGDGEGDEEKSESTENPTEMKPNERSCAKV